MLSSWSSLLPRFASRLAEYTDLSTRIIRLARLSTLGDEVEVQSAVLELSESAGRTEEGMRRLQHGFVGWANDFGVVLAELGASGRGQGQVALDEQDLPQVANPRCEFFSLSLFLVPR